ncbi:MAG: hypothetical protein IT581_06920 [Verrucomicrobiales bacterium]|nr:hypothetical protein [Verrucomicrobiales bacterium]
MNPAAGMRPGLRACLPAWLAAWILPVLSTLAAAPTLEHLYPFTAALGSTQTVTLAGKFDPWPPRFWTQGSGITWTAETNAGKARLEIATDATPGPRLVRLFNDEGASDPRFLLITAQPDLAEVEPNNRANAAQRLETLPARVIGRFEKSGDVDSFTFEVPAGQWLEARVESYVLMSKLDAVLRLLDPQGRQITWNHDSDTLDPRLLWKAEQASTVVLQVFGFRYPADSSVQLSGGDGAIYRLLVDTTNQAPVLIPPNSAVPAVTDASTNDASLAIDPPRVLAGTLDAAGKEDRHPFVVNGGEYIEASVEAVALGSPLDATLRILDRASAELVHVDDSEGSPDPRLVWKAPTNGIYFANVRSLTRRAGPDHRYRLTLRRLAAGARVTLPAGTLATQPGTTNAIKFRISRQAGHTNAVQVRFQDLPPGLSAESVTAPAGDGEGSLSLVVSTNAAAFSGPLTIQAVDATQEIPGLAAFELTSRGENNGVPQGYSRLWINQIDHFWLAIRPPKEK